MAYVASFGGFAVETSILTQARALREKLREDGQKFDVRALLYTKHKPKPTLRPGCCARSCARMSNALTCGP